MAGHTLVLPMGLIVTVPHSNNMRDGWTYTCLTHGTDTDGPTQQEHAMAGHTLVLHMGLLVTVPHSKNRRDGWTYTCLTHGTDSDSPTQQQHA